MKALFKRIWGFHRDNTVNPLTRIPRIAGLSCLTGLGLTFAVWLINTQSIKIALKTLAQSPAWFVLTSLFFALCVMIIAGLTRSLFAGGAVVSLFALLESFVNYFKTLITATPFELQDMLLIGEAGDIAGLNSQYLSISRNSALAIAGVLLWLAVLWFFSKPLRLSWRSTRAFGGASLLAFVLLFVLFADGLIYKPMEVPLSKGYSQSYINGKTGYILGLWRSAIYKDDIAAEYSEAKMDSVYDELQGYIAGFENTENGVKPNVILILSESFFDLTELPGIGYESDPIAEYHALQSEGVSGKFYTKTLGYGTCAIELELLSGVNSRLMPYGEALNTWKSERFELLPTVPKVLHDNGYYTAFLHMFNDGIYNRKNFLPGLGFDDIFFSEDLAQIDPEAAAAGDGYWDFMAQKVSGWFYSDDYMTDVLIDLYEEKAPEGNVFLYAVSMENHSTYKPEKYSEYEYPFTANLGDEAIGTMKAATQGIANASKSLGKLCDYLRTVEEPTVVIFFGDHRPGLGLEWGGTVYSELGMCEPDSSQWTAEQCEEIYSADYLIWANDPSLLPATAGTELHSSSNYLGLDVLETANVSLPDYWKMLSSMRETSTVYNWNYYVSADGEVSIEMPEGMSEADRNKFDVMSYLLHDAYNQKYITDLLF